MKFLFRSVAFNLAIIGLILGLILLWRMSVALPEKTGVRAPASNPYEDSIAASGIIESMDRNVEVGAPVFGLITQVFVHVSDQVKKGQPLFELDPRELQAQLLLEEANVRVAEASLARLEDQLQRLKNVSDPRAVSRDTIETRENDVKVAAMQLDANRAKVKQIKKLLDRLTVRSPLDGLVLQSNIRVGEYYGSNKGEPAMLLGNVDELQVRVDIDEQNASRFLPSFNAVAYPKNNPSIEIPLTFQRIEPFITPKKSLTGASNERVDTRVLQVIYTFTTPKNFKVFVGQQVDVFIHEIQ